MASSTLLVNLETGGSNAGLLQVAGGLADRLGAAVIGVAARQPMQLDVSGTCYVAPGVFDDERAETEHEMDAAEAEFRTAFRAAQHDWRSSVSFASPAGYIAEQARLADLVLTGRPQHDVGDATRATAGELVMQCGRPVLVVPQAPATPLLDNVLLAWKDTREARRATLDSLLLLERAKAITVVEIAAEEDMPAARQRLADVSHWLARHGIESQILACASVGDDPSQLDAMALERGVDLVVAGAYGHSRLREWAFGGVTRTLLHRGHYCAMLSH